MRTRASRPMIAFQPWTAQRRARVQALLILILIFGGAFTSLLLYISTQKPAVSLMTPPTPASNDSALDAVAESPPHRPPPPESKPTTPPKYNFYPEVPHLDENSHEEQMVVEPTETAFKPPSATGSTTAPLPTAVRTPAPLPTHPVSPPPTAQPYRSAVTAAMEARQHEPSASPAPDRLPDIQTSNISLPPIRLVSKPQSDYVPSTAALISIDKPATGESAVPTTPRTEAQTTTHTQNATAVTEQEATSPQSEHHYLLQAGAFRAYAEAERLKTVLAALGIQAHIDSSALEVGSVLHRVRIGPFTSLEQTNAVRRHLHANAIATLVIENKP